MKPQRLNFKPVWLAGLLLMMVVGCSGEGSGGEQHLFESLSPKVTGIDFENRLTFDPDFNIYKYRNFYVGGGVASGDINGDDLTDIFLACKKLQSRFCINNIYVLYMYT